MSTISSNKRRMMKYLFRSFALATLQHLLNCSIQLQLTEAHNYTPCPNSCSGNGKCDLGVCTCFDGFTAADCSLRTCPHGPAYADSASATDTAHNMAECSNRGKCDRITGQCICDSPMFEGSACERFSCPNDCSGKGRCISSKALARLEGKSCLYSDVMSYM